LLAARHKTALASAALAALCAALPATAGANHKPKPFNVIATISACKNDTLTVAMELAPSEKAAAKKVRRRVLRKVRGASLKLRFDAMPLFGDAKRSEEVDLGKTTNGRRFEVFNELPASTYTGVVRYRFMKGKRAVYKGVARTRKARAAGRRGKAFCSLKVGKPPRDTTAPFVTPLPYDNAWKRGPLDVTFFATDDLSGVAGVFWRLDGGPFQAGRRLQITTEGTHTLQYVARDVAGNQSRLGTATLRVDANPPTAPVVTAPAGNTTDTTPDITWNAATDSASGVAFYYVVVRNSSNAIVFAKAVTASELSATVTETLPTGQYTAEVIALDGATPQPFTATGTASFAVIDPTAAPATDSDGDGRTDGADNCPFVSNADQADLDGDKSGDACDTDDDGDGHVDSADNCPTVANDQTNTPGGTSAGDACEDRDSDGVVDATDNCIATANAGQANADGDALGDACDPDVDGDERDDATVDQCDTEPSSNPNGCPSPSVTGSNPSAGGTKTYAQRKDDLTVTFNRAMDATTLDGAITLTRGATTVTESVSCNNPCTVATVNPGEDLGGSYTLNVSTAAKSAEGNALSQSYSASFSASAFSTGFDTCDGYDFDEGTGTDWECLASQLRVVGADRPAGLGAAAYTSIVTTAPILFETAGTDAMRITYAYNFAIDPEQTDDELEVEVLRAGNQIATKTYDDVSASGSDSLAFTATAGPQQYAVRVTLRLASTLTGNSDVGSVVIDNLTLGRT
jgi:hypothetical protein